MTPKIILLVGLPGSGKSTWASAQGLPVISSDHVRELLADSIADQTIHKRVFATVRYLVRHRIAIGRKVTCIDATHLTPKERRPYLKMMGCRVEAVYFATPLEECQRRNQARARVVPPEVIERMAGRLVPPSKAEGFTRVRRIQSRNSATAMAAAPRKLANGNS